MPKPTISITYGKPLEPRQVLPWGWFHLQHPDPAVMEIHLLPASDVGVHAFDVQCACGCHEDPQAAGFFIHMAFDGRERYEHGLARPH